MKNFRPSYMFMIIGIVIAVIGSLTHNAGVQGIGIFVGLGVLMSRLISYAAEWTDE